MKSPKFLYNRVYSNDVVPSTPSVALLDGIEKFAFNRNSDVTDNYDKNEEVQNKNSQPNGTQERI